MAVPERDRTGDGLGAPAVGWYRIVPSNTDLLNPRPRAVYVDVTGILSVEDTFGNVMTMTAAAVGYHPLRPIRVLAATTAVVFGLY